MPSGKRRTMKPPPPMLPAEGCVTESAKPTATAASTALPPAFMISTPIRVALASALATAPCLPCATSTSSCAGAGSPTGSSDITSFAGSESTGSAGSVGRGAVVSPGVVSRQPRPATSERNTGSESQREGRMGPEYRSALPGATRLEDPRALPHGSLFASDPTKRLDRHRELVHLASASKGAAYQALPEIAQLSGRAPPPGNTLGHRPMVGQRTLTPSIKVRILVPDFRFS